MAGRISLRHHNIRGSRRLAAASRRSLGIALAPAITLNRMYHCAPSDINRMPPLLRLPPVASKDTVTRGNKELAGNDASRCTTGGAGGDTLGFNPIHAPKGTQRKVATTDS